MQGVKEREAVQLRPTTLEDAHDLFEAVVESRRELHTWMPWCHPGYCLDDARLFLAKNDETFRAGTEYHFVITAADGRFLGICGLNGIDPTQRSANLGYWVRTSATGRGVASDAVRLLVEWAFRSTELDRLEIVAAVGNLASQQVAAKAGAVFERVAWKKLRLHDAYHDAAIFSFSRAEMAE